MKKNIKTLLRTLKMFLMYLSPKVGVYILHFIHRKKILRLKKPRTIEEKIQWLKFNYYKNNNLVKQCADKYAVREYVRECGCEELLNELIGVYNSVDEINWEELPNKFALKWNFGNGYNIICNEKSQLDIKDAERKLKEWGRISAHLRSFEPQYDVEHKKIICEKFIEPTDDTKYPYDYKVFCFNGRPICMILYTERVIGKGNNKFKIQIFDENMNIIPYKNSSNMDMKKIISPTVFKMMFEYAAILSQPFPFVRVDFYLEKGRMYLGELTFTPANINRIDELVKDGKLPASLLKLPNIQK